MTPQPFSDHLLGQVSDLVRSEMGLHFPPERRRDLEKGIRAAARRVHEEDAELYARRLLSAPLAKEEIQILASELTVGETYFFRDKICFRVLEERILPQFIRARQESKQPLRIWSAGCCTGEEPYSFAILLDRLLPEPRPWPITILATDINPRFLQKAAEGVYGEWSFRDAPAWLKRAYFTEAGPRHYALIPRIREMVTFAYLNLAEDSYPSLFNNTNAMDLIVCRNVLMYFAPQQIKKVSRNFHRALLDPGWLIVSPTETSSELFLPFHPEHAEGAILYQKTTKPPAPGLFVPEIREAPPFEIPMEAPASVFDWRPEKAMPPAIEEAFAAETAVPLATNPQSAYEEALALFENGSYAEAVQRIENGPIPLEKRPEALILQARAHANLGELSLARQAAESAIAIDKLNAAFHYVRAIIVQEQGATEEAVLSLKRALYIEPDFVLAHFALGNHALRLRKFQEADKHFENASAILAQFDPEAVLPGSDGLASGRLKEMIESRLHFA